MKRSWILMLLLSSLLILTSCGGGGGGGSDGNENENGEYSSIDKMVSMSIGDAKSLFINTSNENSNSSSFNSPTKAPGHGNRNGYLFKITTSGEIKEVDFFDKNNKKINMGNVEYDKFGNQVNWGIVYYPVMVKNVNDGYVIISFSPTPLSDSNPHPWIECSYIVRKADGAVFKLKEIPSFGQEIKTDSYNNVYYKRANQNISKSRIVKVNLSLMSSEFVSPSTDDVYGFEVDNEGNIIYQGYNTSSVYRLIKRTGALVNVEVGNSSWGGYWKGIDGNLYYLYVDYQYPSPTTFLVKMFNSSIGSFENYGVFEGNSCNTCGNGVKHAVSKNGINYLYLIEYQGGKLDEVYNSFDNTPKAVSIGDLPYLTVSCSYSTDNYIYIAGRDVYLNNFLIRVTPGGSNLNYDTVLGNEYEVFSFTVSEEDGITFNALRMADGKKVIGRVATTGGPVIILDAESDVKIAYLERIR